MAEEAGEVEDKPKKPILKIILLVVGILVLLGGTVAGTLFFSGFFSKKAAASAEAQLEDAEKAAKVMGLDETKPADPKKNPLDKPDLDKLLDGV